MNGNERVRLRRLALRLTQAEVADRVKGVWTPDISKIEAQGWIPPAAVRSSIAMALSAIVTDLWPGLGESEHPAA
jgi:transcriptional regulator with XRE-family HTH domain